MNDTERKAAMSAIAAALKAARKYLAADQNATYGLESPVSVTIRSERVAAPWLPPAAPFTTKDGFLSIMWREPGVVTLTANPFPPAARVWNGPDVIPNKWFRSMLASLFHDLIWIHDKELAKHLGCSETEVRRWGNDVLYLIWKWASDDSLWGRCEAWLAFQTCQFAAPGYRTARRLLGRALLCALLLGAAAGCSEGCYSLPDGGVIDAAGTAAVEAAMDQ